MGGRDVLDQSLFVTVFSYTVSVKIVLWCKPDARIDEIGQKSKLPLPRRV